ncbi:hypothetical protein LTR86_011100 [Recurvomyces mirabilis]|nr:hypothetical protein LTR86_011100 [Recurvomyces mirabilis]
MSNGEVFDMDKCLSKLFRVAPEEADFDRGHGEYLVSDCGYSTMVCTSQRLEGEDSEKGVEEASKCIDSYLKPEAKSDLTALMGLIHNQWRRVIDVAIFANATLNNERLLKVVEQS